MSLRRILACLVLAALTAGFLLPHWAGASVVTGGVAATCPEYRFADTLLRVEGSRFLDEPENLLAEVFRNESHPSGSFAHGG